jgi:peptide/nickel transport system substrate-binding protein
MTRMRIGQLNLSRWLVAMALIATGCATAPERAGPAPGRVTAEAASRRPARITVVVANEPASLYYTLAPAATRGSAGLLYDLMSPGLSLSDSEGALHPLLVEAIPSIENSLWKLLPDGRMETTWQIRQGARWHDGAAFTSADLLFTLRVVQDRDLPALANRTYSLIEDATAPDERTITLTWRRPFIDADRAFSSLGTASFALPMPRHLLEATYEGNKAAFLDLPYWSHEYIGLGPFRLQSWARGSSITLAASDDYVLGRPKIDEIEARFIPDANTIMSNVLAGQVDLYQGAALGVDQGVQLREQWHEGTVKVIANNWVALHPQFVGPEPAVVLNPQFRKALMYALDRQTMVDTLMMGLVLMAHGPLDVSSREFRATEASLVRYTYDPRRAGQMLQELGYTPGGDNLLRDGSGQPINVEVRGYASRDIQIKGLFPISDNWQRVGVAAEPQVLSAQQASDRQDQATFKSFLLVRQDYHLNRLVAYHSSEARLPERSYAGSNNSRYMNPDMDAAVERYQATVPWPARMEAAGQILQLMTDQLAVMPLFFDMEVALVSHRLRNATPLLAEGSSQFWNVQEWEVR